MKVKALKLTKNRECHGISRKWAFFTEEGKFHGMAVKSWIRLVPRNDPPSALQMSVISQSTWQKIGYRMFHSELRSCHWPDWGSLRRFDACDRRYRCCRRQQTRGLSARQNWQMSPEKCDEWVLGRYPLTAVDWTEPIVDVMLPPAACICTYTYLCNSHNGWLVVDRWSATGELSLSCARPAADGLPLMWVNRPL